MEATIESLGRPLCLLPEPAPDETFGSWLHRSAYAYGSLSAIAFATELLVNSESDPPSAECDFESTPPPALVALLAQRSRFSLAHLWGLCVPRGKFLLAPEHRDAHCVECFAADQKGGPGAYLRRAWLCSRTLTCKLHKRRLGIRRLQPLSEGEIRRRQTDGNVSVAYEVMHVPLARAFCDPVLRRARGTETRKKARFDAADWVDWTFYESPAGVQQMIETGRSDLDAKYYSLFGRTRKPFERLEHSVSGDDLSLPGGAQGGIRARLLAAYFDAVLFRYEPEEISDRHTVKGVGNAMATLY